MNQELRENFMITQDRMLGMKGRICVPNIDDLRKAIVITISRHDLDDHKNKNGVATDLFCTSVIGHPRDMLLN